MFSCEPLVVADCILGIFMDRSMNWIVLTIVLAVRDLLLNVHFDFRNGEIIGFGTAQSSANRTLRELCGHTSLCSD